MRNTFHGLNIVLAAGIVIGLLATAPAKANLIIAVQSVTAGPGNGAFDVTLTNSGPTAASIAGFNFNLSTTDTAISFTDATTATTTAAYIFPAASSFDTLFFGGDLLPSPPNSGQNFNGNVPSDQNVDASFNPLNVSVAAGATVGLGHVMFHIANGATPGGFAITLGAVPSQTNLNDASGSAPKDPNGTPIPINLMSGTLTISAVPEPALFVPLGLALALGGLLRRRPASCRAANLGRSRLSAG
jgi:hypothetical protein